MHIPDDDSTSCTDTSACEYTADDPITANDEEACVGAEHDIVVDIVEEACEATDAAACAAVVNDGTAGTCTGAGSCDYIPEDVPLGISEACVASAAGACAAVHLTGYPDVCTDVAGCSYTPASGVTDYVTVERTLISMGDEQGMVLSDINVTMVPDYSLAVRDAAGKNDLLSINNNIPGYENVDIHAPSLTFMASTWPDESAGTCDPCTCDGDGVVRGWDTGRIGCTMHYLPLTGDPEAVARATSQGGGAGTYWDLTPGTKFCMVHPDCAALGAGCAAVTAELQAGTANEYTCLSAGKCDYIPETAAGANDMACEPIAKHTIPMCTDVTLDNTQATCESRHPGKCVHTPDNVLTPTFDEEACEAVVPGENIPWRKCEFTDPVTDCNDPSTTGMEETQVHGDLNMIGSRFALQRKVVEYMEERNNREMVDVIAFDNSGTLQVTDSKLELMASDSFNLYSPVSYYAASTAASGRRRRLGYSAQSCVATDEAACSSVTLDGNAATCTNAGACTHTPAAGSDPETCAATAIATCDAVVNDGTAATCENEIGCKYVPANGNPVFGISNLASVGDEAAALTVKDLSMSASGSTFLDTGKVQVQISGTDAFVIDPLAGIKLDNSANAIESTKTFTIVTGKTVFRDKNDENDVFVMDFTEAGQEKLNLATPVLDLEARTTIQECQDPSNNCDHKFGGEVTISALKTVMRTSVSNAVGGDPAASRDVDVLTVEDKGILCTVTVTATLLNFAHMLYYELDFEGEQLSTAQCVAGLCCGMGVGQSCTPVGSGAIHGPMDPDEEYLAGARATSPWMSNSKYSWTMQVPGGEHFLRHYSVPMPGMATGYGWYGATVMVQDDTGATIGVRGGISADDDRTYFTVGANGECERVEARINSEYTTIQDRTGATSFLTIDSQDPATSYLSLAAPTITIGTQDSVAVAINGRQVSLQAGNDDALVLKNDAPICATYSITGDPTADATGCADMGDCTYTPVDPSNPASLASCDPLTKSIDSKWDMTFTGKAVFNAGIEMGRSVQTVGFRAKDVTLGNLDVCQPTDKEACETVALNGNPATCTNAGDCTHSPATADTIEMCEPARAADCAAVTVDGTEATCTAVAGCSYVPPEGAVTMIGETTKIKGQDILIQGKCKDDGNEVAAGTFNYVPAHCQSVATGAILTQTEDECNALPSTSAFWELGQCFQGSTQIASMRVEYGKSKLDCDNRMANAASECIDGADHEPSSVRVSANTVKLQAEGIDVITLDSRNSLGKYYQSSPYELGGDTEVKFTADTVRFQNKAGQITGDGADSDDMILLTSTFSGGVSNSEVVLSGEKVQVGKKYYDPLRYVFDGSPGLNGKCSTVQNMDGSYRTEAQCAPGGWTTSSCTRISDNYVMQTGGYEADCLSRNFAGQTTSVEGTTVTITAADEVRLDAPTLNMVSDVTMSRNMAFSVVEEYAAAEITVDADTTMVVVLHQNNIQQNSLTLPTTALGSDPGNMLIIYNNDDDPVQTNSGDVAPGKSGLFIRTSTIGWVCGTCV
jgi:hypothetical protein